MTWWVLSKFSATPGFTTLDVRANTSHEDHLFLAWAYHKPARHPIYRIVRGKRVRCGYKYVWDTPTIAEQVQSGDTLYHRFSLLNLQSNSTIWFYIFAPDGPFGLEIQGPLQHATLLALACWPPNLFVATKLKGVYATRTMSGPGEPHPTWIQINEGLHSLHCWQYHANLIVPADRHYLIAGDPGDRIVYRLMVPDIPWWLPFWPILFPDWEPLLTNADCLALTGWPSGEICWLTTNTHLPGRIYVLFHHPISYDGAACIRSHDYGQTWESFPISPGPVAYTAGNIIAGVSRGTSPHGVGSVLYAAINNGLGGHFRIYISTDWGQSWALAGSTQLSVAVPRVMVDPSDQSILYIGAHVNIPNPNELFRSTDHGADLIEIDFDHHLGFYLNAFWGQMWLEQTDIFRARVLVQNHVWQTTDFCETWTDPGPTAVAVSRLSILGHSPDYLYLGRRTNAPAFGWPGYPHVFFISDTEGLTMWGKCGAYAAEDDGHGDSIPWNCGGLAHDGILHPYPA